MEETTPFVPPSEAKPYKKWPSGTQAAVLIGSGFVLGIGGCAAFLATMQHEIISFIFGALFFVGLILVFAGVVEILVMIVKALMGRN